MKFKEILFIILYFSCFFCVYASDIVQEPDWVYLKRAENLKEKGEYALAMIEAKKARMAFIKEKIDNYRNMISDTNREKIDYELKKMVKRKEEELLINDNYPQYHELMADIYILSDFLDEAEKEYKIALSQSDYFEYSQKDIEIKYKLADINNKRRNYELEDILYRDIVKGYFKIKNEDYWARIRYNIKKDPSLNHIYRIYRIEGIEYLQALYKIGRRSALLKRKNEALFYLANAAIVWMTYYSSLIKKNYYEFQYTNPSDFINYISKKQLYESRDSIMDEVLFYIGYIYYLEKSDKIKNYYFDLSKIYSKTTNRKQEIRNRIKYFEKDANHILTYQEISN